MKPLAIEMSGNDDVLFCGSQGRMKCFDQTGQNKGRANSTSRVCLLGPPPTSSCLVLFHWCGLTHTSLCIYPIYKMFGLDGGLVLCYECCVCQDEVSATGRLFVQGSLAECV